MQDPPGFLVFEPLHKAAWDNGFRLSLGAEGGWIGYGSTTAAGGVWLGGENASGPWWLAVDHPGVVAEFGEGLAEPSRGRSAYSFDTLGALHAALERAYRLGASLPNAPLMEFEREVAGLPRETEAERLVVQRVGQNVFRRALLRYWDNRCAVTGLGDVALLKASHILPWAECTNDAQRLDVHNGLLLSALWDAAFDAHLVSFDDEGRAIFGAGLSPEARGLLGQDAGLSRSPGQPQRAFLHSHRARLES